MGNIVYEFLTQTRFRFFRHLVYLLALTPIALAQAFFVLGNSFAERQEIIYQFGFVFALVLIGFSYFSRFVLTSKFLLKDRYTEFIVHIWISLFVLMGVKYHVESVMMDQVRGVNWVTILDWASNCTLYSICIASSSAPLLFRRWVQDQGQIADLEKERLAYRLEDYKNRINPQLIKAGILYAARQVTVAPEQVSAFLQQLSATLRYQLYDYQRDQVLLKSELQFLEYVVALREQVAGVKFDLEILTSGNLNRFIAPGLLLPLVEPVMDRAKGAIKVSCSAPAFAEIEFEISAERLDLRTCDLEPLEQRLKFLEIEHTLYKKQRTLKLQLC